MRRPWVRFWKAVFIASVVLFVAGTAVAVISAKRTGAVHVTSCTSILYGRHDVGVVREADSEGSHDFAQIWNEVSHDPLFKRFWKRTYFRWPWAKVDRWSMVFVVPANYLYLAPIATGLIAVTSLRRVKKDTSARCPQCRYSLAGLSVDATACPECGGKIRKSTT